MVQTAYQMHGAFEGRFLFSSRANCQLVQQEHL